MRRLLISIRLLWRGIHAQSGTAEAIGRGIAIGLFMGMMPFFGFQMLLAFAAAWIVRGNRVVALIPAWISNPFTAPVILWVEYAIGSSIIYGRHNPSAEATIQRIRGLMETASTHGWLHSTIEAVKAVWGMGWAVLGPITLGALVMGIVFAVPGYLLTVCAVRKVRKRRQKKRESFFAKHMEPPEETGPGMPD